MRVEATDLERDFSETFARSRELFREAKEHMPGGLTHDSRWLEPFPVFVDRAEGPYKWTVDGRRLIDYWMGHGALILGHGHPSVRRALAEQLERGTHFGASHPLEVEWARLVTEMVPGAERVRFVNSGTEATQLAMRLARAHTGRTRVAKFAGHFHGWHDEAVTGNRGPFGVTASTGASPAALAATVALPAGDADALRRALSDLDVAAVIVEPGGGGWGAVPMEREFLALVREETRRAGAVLIFDEVITGFRLARGGAQEHYGIRADLVCLGKIVAGGLPGAAVAGPAEMMAYLEYRDEEWNRRRKIAHQGTFNGNPLTAAAAVATLKQLRDGRLIRRAAELCRRLCDGLNGALARSGVTGYAYRQASMFHIALGVEPPGPADGEPPRGMDPGLLEQAAKGPRTVALRKAMLLEGVDLMRSGGFLSAAHSPADVEETVAAFERALARLKREGLA
ncbi:MAG: aspartate aminotransferase family protein [Firmicutes bacterium]|nr:aspartate aminotransferase family protein [Bacillota bacterium]